MNVTFSRQALSDLDEILHYISLRNPRAADRIHAVVEQTIRRIAGHPYSAQQVTDEAVLRRVALVRLPYLIYYEIGEIDVTILRISIAQGSSPGTTMTELRLHDTLAEVSSI